MILGVSYFYISVSSQSLASQQTIIQPRVNVETNDIKLPVRVYGDSSREPFFHSAIGTNHNSKVYYRPNFRINPEFTILFIYFELATYSVLVLFLYHFARMSISVSDKKSLSPSSTRRIGYLGWLLVFLAATRTLHSMTLAGFLTLNPGLLDYKFSPVLGYLWIAIPGFIILTISFFIKEYVSVNEEQKLNTQILK